MPFLFYQQFTKQFFLSGRGGGTLLCHGVLCGHERFVKGKQLVKESLHDILFCNLSPQLYSYGMP